MTRLIHPGANQCVLCLLPHAWTDPEDTLFKAVDNIQEGSLGSCIKFYPWGSVTNTSTCSELVQYNDSLPEIACDDGFASVAITVKIISRESLMCNPLDCDETDSFVHLGKLPREAHGRLLALLGKERHRQHEKTHQGSGSSLPIRSCGGTLRGWLIWASKPVPRAPSGKRRLCFTVGFRIPQGEN